MWKAQISDLYVNKTNVHFKRIYYFCMKSDNLNNVLMPHRKLWKVFCSEIIVCLFCFFKKNMWSGLYRKRHPKTKQDMWCIVELTWMLAGKLNGWYPSIMLTTCQHYISRYRADGLRCIPHTMDYLQRNSVARNISPSLKYQQILLV